MELLLVTLSARVQSDVTNLLICGDTFLNELLDNQVCNLLQQLVVLILDKI